MRRLKVNIFRKRLLKITPYERECQHSIPGLFAWGSTLVRLLFRPTVPHDWPSYVGEDFEQRVQRKPDFEARNKALKLILQRGLQRFNTLFEKPEAGVCPFTFDTYEPERFREKTEPKPSPPKPLEPRDQKEGFLPQSKITRQRLRTKDRWRNRP